MTDNGKCEIDILSCLYWHWNYLTCPYFVIFDIIIFPLDSFSQKR